MESVAGPTETVTVTLTHQIQLPNYICRGVSHLENGQLLVTWFGAKTGKLELRSGGSGDVIRELDIGDNYVDYVTVYKKRVYCLAFRQLKEIRVYSESGDLIKQIPIHTLCPVNFIHLGVIGEKVIVHLPDENNLVFDLDGSPQASIPNTRLWSNFTDMMTVVSSNLPLLGTRISEEVELITAEGRSLWRYRIDEAVAACTRGNKIYVADESSNGRLHVINAQTAWVNNSRFLSLNHYDKANLTAGVITGLLSPVQGLHSDGTLVCIAACEFLRGAVGLSIYEDQLCVAGNFTGLKILSLKP